jgi:shikimate dehydrogenase
MDANDLAPIQAQIVNTLPANAATTARFAGIIGDRPSQYAKSPSLWNAVFKALGLDAVYVAFDVDEPSLGNLVKAMRRNERLLGGNVTVPYKVKVMEHLDDLDPKARQIGAVNTIVRTPEGKLVGYNTDGSGFLWSLTKPLLAGEAPLLPDPKGVDSVLIGAGGAARAVAFYLAEAIDGARLVIANRNRAAAAALADEVNRAQGNATAIGEDDLAKAVASAGLVVNCSTKGQYGLRKLAGGQVTMLEPYSALASASPATFPEADASKPGFQRRWFEASLADITRNVQQSGHVTTQMPGAAVAYDLVYAPLETVFLTQARLSGHRTANGKGMNVAQAVDALFGRVCRGWFQTQGLATDETHRRIVQTMCEVW